MNYSNPTQLQAAILDWAGTVVDFGSFAPVSYTHLRAHET